ncbi:MAG: DUF4129 domain-containing protein [Sphingomonadales bacterium]
MQEGRIAGQTNEAASAAERLAAAHKALTAASSVQFDMPPAPPPPQTPAWLRAFLEWLEHALKPVGRLFRWIGSFLPDAPYARILFWTVIALAAAALLGLVYQRLRHGEWRLPRRRSRFAAEAEAEEASRAPEAAPAQAWLEEADALAAQGRFAEAAHHLLFRSVEDIARRRPSLVRPALTSRELASASAVPPTARELFARIAALVERSLFGGRAVDAGDWTSARAAYADFVLPRAWRA